MKIAITAEGKDKTSAPDPRFGRAAYFVVMEGDTGEIIEAIENEMKNASGGAGVSAAQNVAGLGVDVLITGALGPKAFSVINQIGLDVYAHQNEKTIEDTYKAFKEGRLERISKAK